ncbi:hypothetical protein BGX26_011901 [Mortierella sp. AD094]|nr:hypothetical protein BGX26_011901 [Mortierella sp. AD094]
MATTYDIRVPVKAFFRLRFALSLLLIMVLNVNIRGASAGTGPGPRSEACTFGYNNTYYVLGGIMDASDLYSVFVSTPLPLSLNGTNSVWIDLPSPPGWQPMSPKTALPQFHCACNKDGKVFLFGNVIGFAVYDTQTGKWDIPQPAFSNPILSINSFRSQEGLHSAVHPDGYTISIVTTANMDARPQIYPIYMVLDSRNMTINGVVQTGLTSYHGFCMGVIPTTPTTSEAIMCGGSFQTNYSSYCYQLNLVGFPIQIATLPAAQDACSLIPFNNGFLFVQGFLSTNLNGTSVNFPPPSVPNPMSFFGLNSKSWTTVPNNQQLYLPSLFYVSATLMPGTNTVVFEGGWSQRSPTTDGIYMFNINNNSFVPRVDPAPDAWIITTTPGSGISVGAIVGITVGAVVVVCAAIFAIRYFRRSPSRQNIPENSSEPIAQNYLPAYKDSIPMNSFEPSGYHSSQQHGGSTPMNSLEPSGYHGSQQYEGSTPKELVNPKEYVAPRGPQDMQSAQQGELHYPPRGPQGFQ